jgi:hypothetical protein
MMHPKLLACPDCGSRSIKALAATRDRHPNVNGVLIGLKCCDCKTGFTITVERHAAKKSERLTSVNLQVISQSGWLCN